jgi:carbonic anhydrase
MYRCQLVAMGESRFCFMAACLRIDAGMDTPFLGEFLMRLVLTAALLMAASTLALTQTAVPAPQGAPWDYEGKRGALEWGKLDPAYKACSQGKEQSPIDIRGAKLDKSLQPIEFHYMAGPVTLVNTGHTVQVIPGPGSYMVAGGVRYDLVNYHFHHPGEEAVKGKITDMNVHLVHKSADGKIAVVAIRLTESLTSPPNAVLAQLFSSLPAKTGDTAKITEMVNPGGLLPADRGYWTYVGSLTAPPCTEGVRWFIFEQEMTLSRTQLAEFAKLYKVNSRGVQDLHGRKIEADE